MLTSITRYLRWELTKKMIIDTYIYKGTRESINKNLSVVYNYKFEQNGTFQTIKENRNNTGYIIYPSYAISISEGMGKQRIFIPGNRYYAFTTLLDKAIKLISENLFTIFPNVNKVEFETDSRALERFQNEKALMTAGMTAVPAVWPNEVNECFPGIQISSTNGAVIIPLEDAIPLVEMLKHFDPIVYSVSMLRFFGKIE